MRQIILFKGPNNKISATQIYLSIASILLKCKFTENIKDWTSLDNPRGFWKGKIKLNLFTFAICAYYLNDVLLKETLQNNDKSKVKTKLTETYSEIGSCNVVGSLICFVRHPQFNDSIYVTWSQHSDVLVET